MSRLGFLDPIFDWVTDNAGDLIDLYGDFNQLSIDRQNQLLEQAQQQLNLQLSQAELQMELQSAATEAANQQAMQRFYQVAGYALVGIAGFAALRAFKVI